MKRIATVGLIVAVLSLSAGSVVMNLGADQSSERVPANSAKSFPSAKHC